MGQVDWRGGMWMDLPLVANTDKTTPTNYYIGGDKRQDTVSTNGGKHIT